MTAYTYTYTRELLTGLTGDQAQYNNCYDIDNPLHVDNDGAPVSLYQDICLAWAYLDPCCMVIKCDNAVCQIIFNDKELTEEEKIQLDQMVTTHKNDRGAQ
jgi:hypothetical protein